MKTLTAFLLAIALTGRLLAQADNETFQNADFSDGTTHWHGDCKPAGSEDSNDLLTSSAGGVKGIVIDLHSMGWTKVTQDLHEYKFPSSKMTLTIVYQASADLKLSAHPADYGNIGPKVGFGGANIAAAPGQVTAMIDVAPDQRATSSNPTYNSSGSYNTVTVYYDKVAAASFAPSTDGKPQTFTAVLQPPIGNRDNLPTFCLAFPPGTGSITITKISLTSADFTSGQMPR